MRLRTLAFAFITSLILPAQQIAYASTDNDSLYNVRSHAEFTVGDDIEPSSIQPFLATTLFEDSFDACMKEFEDTVTSTPDEINQAFDKARENELADEIISTMLRYDIDFCLSTNISSVISYRPYADAQDRRTISKEFFVFNYRHMFNTDYIASVLTHEAIHPILNHYGIDNGVYFSAFYEYDVEDAVKMMLFNEATSYSWQLRHAWQERENSPLLWQQLERDRSVQSLMAAAMNNAYEDNPNITEAELQIIAFNAFFEDTGLLNTYANGFINQYIRAMQAGVADPKREIDNTSFMWLDNVFPKQESMFSSDLRVSFDSETVLENLDPNLQQSIINIQVYMDRENNPVIVSVPKRTSGTSPS